MIFYSRKLFISAWAVLFGITACKKQETLPPANLYTTYYPLTLHSSITYDVDSTHYNDFNHSAVNYLFELKDTVVSVLEEDNSRYTVRIERYKREPSDGKWKFQKMITRTLTGRRGEEFIENQRFVRLIFPPRQGSTWNGNTYNNLGEQPCEILAVHQPLQLNQIELDSTLTVKLADEINLIREDVVTEVYANHIGLVKKEVKALNKDISSGIITSGFIYSMVMKAYQ